MADFNQVQHDELGAIEESRCARGQTRPIVRGEPSDATKRAGESQLLGLSFSGGGIRSATFNLGVLQALADLNLLKRFDYLSTVSGGGFIGSWLTAWIHRAPPDEKALKGGKGREAACLETVVQRLKTKKEREEPALAGTSAVGQSNKERPHEPPEVRWLRRYSNYLTPQVGLFSGDTWAFVGAYLRNTSLNLTILILALIPAVLLPRLGWIVFLGLGNTPEVPGDRWYPDYVSLASVFLAGFLLWFAISLTFANLLDLKPTKDESATPAHLSGKKTNDPDRWYQSRIAIYFGIILPFLSAAFLLWCAAWSARKTILEWGWLSVTGAALLAGLLLVLLWMGGWSVGRALIPKDRWQPGFIRKVGESGICPCRIIWTSVFGGMLGGGLVWFLIDQFQCHFPAWHQALWGAPLMVGVFLAVQTLHIGLAGNGFTEREREWWGRLGGVLLVVNLALSALVFLVLDGPWLFLWLEERGYWSQWIKWAAGAAWVTITGGGVLAGRSDTTGGEKSPPSLELLGKVAPATFIAGLALLLAFGAHFALDLDHQCEKKPPEAVVSPSPCSLGRIGDCFKELCAPLAEALTCLSAPQEEAEAGKYWARVEKTLRFGPAEANVSPASSFGLHFAIIAFGLLLAYLLSRAVGINEFSMHYLYRNRLVRCYLGASRKNRNPQLFTGFDLDDDIWFCNVVPDESCKTATKGPRTYPGPYHIVNAAINLVSGKNLAWQQRKAASFVITPSYTGYQFDGEEGRISAFQETGSCAGGQRSNPLTLGMAVATSGAAASPNMGYQSSPTWAFLMTIFNVRLGWWLQNPHDSAQDGQAKDSHLDGVTAWKKMGPTRGLFYLLKELTGDTNENADFVYLSDGGHFENLGIYELVRRRCRYIVACDAGADPNHTFEDLGNAIEKCRADFGINIDINVDQIRKNPDTGKGEWHCAVGRIEYDKEDPEMAPGTLLYIKAALTGDEPTDVARYSSLHKEFPHESTADQWFDESQFESYRMLGHHTTREVFEAVGDEESLAEDPLSHIFVNLRQRWHPRSHATAESFTKHTATYRSLLRNLRESKDLQFLDAQIYPEWPALMTPHWNALHPERGALWLPDREEERRAGFYFCNEMIQLLEDAYTDLYLEDEYEHPDNRGWMNLMQHCAWSGMFSATYAICANLYGARFQKFCERRLDLRPGRVDIPEQSSWRTVLWDGDPATLDQALEDVYTGWRSGELNFWEATLVRTFVRFARPGRPLYVIPLQIEQAAADRHPAHWMRFAFGFALVSMHANEEEGKQNEAVIQFIRVQNHLRTMGLGRTALGRIIKVLGRNWDVKVRERGISQERIDEVQSMPGTLLIPENSAEWEAVPREEQVRKLRHMFEAVKRR